MKNRCSISKYNRINKNRYFFYINKNVQSVIINQDEFFISFSCFLTKRFISNAQFSMNFFNYRIHFHSKACGKEGVPLLTHALVPNKTMYWKNYALSVNTLR